MTARKSPFSPPYTGQAGTTVSARHTIRHRTNHPAGHQQPFGHFRPKKMAHRNGAPSIPKNTVQFDTSSKSIS
jgi:hypothetical protein